MLFILKKIVLIVTAKVFWYYLKDDISNWLLLLHAIRGYFMVGLHLDEAKVESYFTHLAPDQPWPFCDEIPCEGQ